MIHSNSGKLVGFLAGLAMAVLGAAPLVFGETCGITGFGTGLACCNTVASTTGGICAAPANTKYEFTLNRFCFELSDGTLPCVGTLTTFNAASISIGDDFGAFVTGQSVEGLDPDDTIVAMRPEVAKSFTVNGGGQPEHTTTDATACSSGGDQTVDLSQNAGGGSIPACSAEPDKQCETSDGFIRIRDTSLGNVLFTATGLTINFDFDVGSGLIFLTGGGACTYNSIGPLIVEMSLP